MTNALKPHELAEFYPMHDPARFADLVEGMKKSGYRDEFPIVVYEGKILDGRNRYNAALEAGVEPYIVQFSGDDPVEFVMQANSNRRDLEPGQRVVIHKNIRKKYPKGGERWVDLSARINQKNSQKEFAKQVGVSTGTVARVEYVEKHAPELLDKVASGELPAETAYKKAREKEITAYRTEIAQVGALVKPADKWNVYHADIQSWNAPRKYDFIITDPPYPKEYLHLYEVLAYQAVKWLKPGGLVIAMAGQSYLDEVYAAMSKHLQYYWTASYLTPGSSASLRQKQVNTQWKPLLVYGMREDRYTGKIFNDVFTSGENEDFTLSNLKKPLPTMEVSISMGSKLRENS